MTLKTDQVTKMQGMSAMQSQNDRPPLIDLMIRWVLSENMNSQSWARRYFTARGEEFASCLQPYLSDRSLTRGQLNRVAEAIELCHVEVEKGPWRWPAGRYGGGPTL